MLRTMESSREPRASSTEPTDTTKAAVGSVQSVVRALDILETLEAVGGAATISDIAAATSLPIPTAHRLAQTLVGRGYLRQLGDRRYSLGSRLVPLGAAATSRLGDLATPVLHAVAAATGESANLAVLSGERAEYVRQAPGRHAMRMFTEVGRRVPLHSTGVGKAILSLHTDDEVRSLLRGNAMPAQTPRTITSVAAMLDDVEAIRARGYALDDEEMEIGVRCVAVPIRAGSAMAISVSGPSTRMTDDQVDRSALELQRAAEKLRRSLRA
jgi:IclR family transcriptional regulator, acetate operon repressor